MKKLVSAVVLSLVLWPPSKASAAGLKLGGEQIVGRIQRPEIQYILTKQDLTPKYEFELKESFVPRMIQSVNSRNF